MPPKTELFTTQSPELQRSPIRPLGDLSNFVVENLPLYLTNIRTQTESGDNLSQIGEELVAGLSPDIIAGVAEDPSDLDVALLDLLYLEHGIIHSNGKPKERLSTMVDRFSAQAGRIPTMTYEDLVLINPLDTDPRTFTEGDMGRSEWGFYKGHNLIERDLQAMIDREELARGLLLLGEPDVATAVDLLHSTTGQRQRILDLTHDIGMAMSKGDFNLFRNYFKENTVRGFTGPSGAFSHRVPLFEILLAGEEIHPSFIDYIQRNNPYYPRDGRAKLMEALTLSRRGYSLKGISETLGNPADLRSELEMQDNWLIKFRNMHLGAVKHQLPEVFEGTAVGTSGETGQFLRDRNIPHFDS